MGTKVHCKSYLPGYYSMRDLNENSSSSSSPFCYGDNPNTTGHYSNGFMPRTTTDGYPVYDEDALKQKILDHEAVFKNQVNELHRLYGIQRDMMEDAEKKEPYKSRASVGPGFPFLNSGYGRKSSSGVEIVNSPMSCTKGYNNMEPGQILFQNSRDTEGLESRPSKMRKRLSDLQLAADEQAKAPPFIDFLGHSSINGDTKGAQSNAAGYLGVNGEIVHTRDRFLINSSLESKINDSGWRRHMYEAGSSKSNVTSLNQVLQQDKLHIHHPSGTYQTGYRKENHSREGNHYGLLESSYRSRDHSDNSHFEPLVASRAPPGSSHPIFGTSYFASSRAQPVPFWENSTTSSSSTQKMTTFDSCLNPTTSQEPFGGKWIVNASSRLNLGSGSELTRTNEFYHGSGVDYLNRSRGDNVASKNSSNHGFLNFEMGPCHPDSKPAIGINLNEASSNEEDLTMVDGKTENENHLSALPWLKRKPVRDLNETAGEKENRETRNVTKVLGFPIFETGALKNEPSSLVSTSASVGCQSEGSNVDRERKRKRIIDINVEYEPDEEIAVKEPSLDKEKHIKGFNSVREYIDLNSCVSDCEDPSAPSYESKTASGKIDPEASVHSLETKNEQTRDEVLENAAEAIFAMSSSFCPKSKIFPPEVSLEESLLWAFNVMSSCADELESPKTEMDDFEAMTLQLQETKEEDYMPIPFVPDFQIMEETKSRRGQSRRGRQRRNFQKDIIPGMTSLSRNEVSEDIQIFGGLMRATGYHQWSSGLTRRRNGSKGRKGRKRAVVESAGSLVEQVNKNEVCGLEERRLTGWGKTIRRPRGQRCPASNLATVCFT